MAYLYKKLGPYTIKVGSGITPKGGRSTYSTSGIPFIRSQNVLWGRLDLFNVAYISQEQHRKMPKTDVKPGDLLLNITGASIGRACVVPTEFKYGNVNQHVCIIRTKKELRSEYLLQFILSSQGQKQIAQFQAGGNRQGLNFKQIRSLLLPIPTLPEQFQITELLRTWDEAIEKLEKLITAKERKNCDLVRELICKKEKIWKPKKLGNLFTERTEINCGSFELLSITAGRGVVRRTEVDKVDSSSEDKSKYLRICPGDIGYNTMRMWQGVCGLSAHDGIISPAYTVLIPSPEVDATFCSFYFKAPHVVDIFKRHSQGLVDDTLNLKYSHFSRIKLPFPPKEEQLRIAQILSTARSEIEILAKQLTALQKQKRGLMEKLLTGTWRV
ncbi:MAG: restriction endonuclease subunit S [Kiritimatiellales bacterium]